MNRLTSKSLLALFAVLLTSWSAHAATIGPAASSTGEYLGTFNRPETEQLVEVVTGLDVSLVERVDIPDTASGFLEIFNLVLNDDGDIIAGEWAYTGPETITHLTLTRGPVFALYAVDGSNSGTFDTSDIGNKGLESLGIYTTATQIPLPAAAWLMLSGLAGLIGFGRRKR